MNQNLVGSILDKDIYLVNDKNIPYFIGIPKGEKVSIVLNLVNNTNEINISFTNPMEVKEKILKEYSKFGGNDNAVVTPVISNNIMEQVKLPDNGEYISHLNKVLGYLINVSYRYLKDNGKEVYEKIKLDNNDTYKDFINKFVSMYSSRVELVDYKPENASDKVIPFNREPRTVIPDSELDTNENLANTTTIALDDAYKEIGEEATKTVDNKEAGFVSYVLLGVVVAVISLVILYMLL